MLRIVRAVQFILNKIAALVCGKGSDEMRASEFIGEARSSAVSEPNEQSDREKLIRRRWLALLWQIYWVDRLNWIPESDFQ
jgi:hypothetical protein